MGSKGGKQGTWKLRTIRFGRNSPGGRSSSSREVPFNRARKENKSQRACGHKQDPLSPEKRKHDCGDGRAGWGSAERQRDAMKTGSEAQGTKPHAPTSRGHRTRPGQPGRRGGSCTCAGARAASPSPAAPEAQWGATLSPPAVSERLSPERGSKVTTNTATTWSSSTSPSSRRPGCSSTWEGPSSSGSRLLGGSTAARPPLPPPQPRPPACGSGASGGETAGPSAQRSSGASSPRSTMAR